MKFDDKTMQRLYGDAKECFDAMAQGKTAMEAASDLYVRALPDKEKELGDVMAERIEEVVKEYEQLAKDALENPDTWIDRQLERLGENRTRVERCKLLMQLVAGVNAVNASLAGEEVQEPMLMSLEFDENAATEALENELVEALKEGLNASNLGAVQLEALGEALNGLPTEEIRQGVVDFGKSAHDRKVVLAMTAYVGAKNGTLEGVSPEATIEQITTAVCLAEDTQRVCQQAQEGSVDEEQAPRIIRALGEVALCLLIGMSSAHVVSTFAMPVLNSLASLIGCASLAQPVGLVLAIGIAVWLSMESEGVGAMIADAAWLGGKKGVQWIKEKARSMRDKKKEKQQAQAAAEKYEEICRRCTRQKAGVQQNAWER